MEVQTYGRVEVREEAGYAGVFATAPFKEGAVIMELTGVPRTEADRYSIQVDVGTHLAPSDTPEADGEGAWRFMNHACDPNVRVDVEARRLVARRAIGAGEELTFNYNTTEWEMAEPFDCGCGAAVCEGEVGGYARLSDAHRQRLEPDVAPHLRELARG